MIGPITFAIRPTGTPPGPVTIFINFANNNPKIAVQNSNTGKNVNVIWQDSKTGTGLVLPAALQPGSTAVFNISANWVWLLVDTVNPADQSSIEVFYE